MVCVVFGDTLGTRFALCSAHLLDVGACQDFTASRLEGHKNVRGPIQLLFRSLLNRQLLINKLFEDFVTYLACLFGRGGTSGYPAKHEVDLMHRNLFAVDLGRHLTGRCFLVFATASSEPKHQ